jgi:hypothetical protein
MTKNKTLVNENVIRRWGKLASIPALTENFLDTIEEESLEGAEAAEEDAMDAMDDAMDQMDDAEDDMDSAEADAEREVVDRVVQAVVSALSDATDVEIEVEGSAEDEEVTDAELELVDDGGEEEVEFEEEELEPGMRAYNRKDLDERRGDSSDDQGGKNYTKKDKKADRKEDRKEREKYDRTHHTHGGLKGEEGGEDFDGDEAQDKRHRKSRNRKDETLELDVIDDEELTEAVLQRVVERLLQRK